MENQKIYSIVEHLLKLQDQIDRTKNEIFIQETKLKNLQKESDDLMMAIQRLN